MVLQNVHQKPEERNKPENKHVDVMDAQVVDLVRPLIHKHTHNEKKENNQGKNKQKQPEPEHKHEPPHIQHLRNVQNLVQHTTTQQQHPLGLDHADQQLSWNMFADILQQRGLWQQSRYYFEQATQFEAFAATHIAFAGLLKGLKEFPAAEQQLQAAIQISPLSEPAHFNYGLLLEDSLFRCVVLFFPWLFSFFLLCVVLFVLLLL